MAMNIETPARDPKVLLAIHAAQAQRLGLRTLYHLGSNNPRRRLYEELLVRHAKVPVLLDTDRELAFETMYGIALGLDGLETRWSSN